MKGTWFGAVRTSRAVEPGWHPGVSPDVSRSWNLRASSHVNGPRMFLVGPKSKLPKCPQARIKHTTYPRHSMYMQYMPTLTPNTTPTDRHIWQSHGVSGYYPSRRIHPQTRKIHPSPAQNLSNSAPCSDPLGLLSGSSCGVFLFQHGKRISYAARKLFQRSRVALQPLVCGASIPYPKTSH